MADPKIVREWLQKADEDLNFARSNLHEGNDFYAQICFHFHQAAEKYLKSYIVAYDLEFEKTHNLIKLLTICSSQEPTILRLMKECERLNIRSKLLRHVYKLRALPFPSSLFFQFPPIY